MNYTACVAGGSGLAGAELIRQLISDSKYAKIIVLTRRRLNFQDSKIAQVVCDLGSLDSHVNELKADHYYCCLGTTIKKAGSQEEFRKVDYEYVLNFAKLAKSNQAKSFAVVSALGANPSSAIFYNRVKGQMESILAELGLKKLIILRPSFLLGERGEARPAERMALKIFTLLDGLFVGPLRKWAAVPIQYVAKAMIVCSQEASNQTKVLENNQIFEYRA